MSDEPRASAPTHRDCGKCGEYRNQVPMPIRNRVRYIDRCIAPVVAALNAAGITTEASCCGHGTQPGSIVLEDGRHLVIAATLEQGNALVVLGRERTCGSCSNSVGVSDHANGTGRVRCLVHDRVFFEGQPVSEADNGSPCDVFSPEKTSLVWEDSDEVGPDGP